jgi:hypothetical protein
MIVFLSAYLRGVLTIVSSGIRPFSRTKIVIWQSGLFPAVLAPIGHEFARLYARA